MDNVDRLREDSLYRNLGQNGNRERAVKIVIVDDMMKPISSFMKQELMHVVRSSKGVKFNIMDFRGPEVALQYLASYKPDLLISDIKTPFLSGNKLLEGAKRLHPDLPMIVVGEFPTRKNILSTYSGDQNSIMLTKPWDEPDRLLQAIHQLLGLNFV